MKILEEIVCLYRIFLYFFPWELIYITVSGVNIYQMFVMSRCFFFMQIYSLKKIKFLKESSNHFYHTFFFVRIHQFLFTKMLEQTKLNCSVNYAIENGFISLGIVEFPFIHPTSSLKLNFVCVCCCR